MPTTTGGLNFTYPNEASTGWFSTIVAMYNVLSAHDHSGAPNGSTIPTAGITADAVTGAKIRLDNDEYLRGRNNADSADINILKVATSDALVINPATLFNAGIEITGDIQVDGGDFLDANGNELFKITSTGSAVNELTLANAATGNGPTISATGDDAAVDINITPKGTGDLVLDGQKWPQADGTADYVIKTDGSGQLSYDTPGVLQVVSTTLTTATSTTSTFPADDTIPQNTEGAELMTLSITPKSASSTLYIRFHCGMWSKTTDTTWGVFALFRDSTADALISSAINPGAINFSKNTNLIHSTASSSTSSTTFKIRIGTVNGAMQILQLASTSYFSTADKCVLEIWEVL
jgi:hypothetical protein